MGRYEKQGRTVSRTRISLTTGYMYNHFFFLFPTRPRAQTKGEGRVFGFFSRSARKAQLGDSARTGPWSLGRLYMSLKTFTDVRQDRRVAVFDVKIPTNDRVGHPQIVRYCAPLLFWVSCDTTERGLCDPPPKKTVAPFTLPEDNQPFTCHTFASCCR